LRRLNRGTPAMEGMYGQPGGFRQRIEEIAAKFREKGATSAANAMTAQELGLPPRFEQAMGRRLGRTGVFVAVGGKYYLDEARFQEFQQRWASGGQMWARRKNMVALRMARMVVGLSVVGLALLNILFIQNWNLRYVTVTLLVVWIALTVYQMYYVSGMRRMMGPPPGASFSGGRLPPLRRPPGAQAVLSTPSRLVARGQARR